MSFGTTLLLSIDIRKTLKRILFYKAALVLYEPSFCLGRQTPSNTLSFLVAVVAEKKLSRQYVIALHLLWDIRS